MQQGATRHLKQGGEQRLRQLCECTVGWGRVEAFPLAGIDQPSHYLRERIGYL